MAKLLVPAGAPVQARAGDTFSPEQPKELKTNLLSIALAALTSLLLRLNFPAADAPKERLQRTASKGAARCNMIRPFVLKQSKDEGRTYANLPHGARAVLSARSENPPMCWRSRICRRRAERERAQHQRLARRQACGVVW